MSVFANIEAEQLKSLKSRDRNRLLIIRLIISEIKSFEINAKSRAKASDQDIFGILTAMLKLRKDFIKQYESIVSAERISKEKLEIDVIKEFLPRQFSNAEVVELVEVAIGDLKASSVADIGSVISFLKPKLIGRADMSYVASIVKKKLF